MASLTATQMRYLALAWQCFETEPKIDYAKFADVAGLKSAASAREMMRVTKKKLFEAVGTDALDAGPSTPVAKTPKNKATPATKASTGKTKGRKRKVEVESDEEDEKVMGVGKKVKSEPVEENGEESVMVGAKQDDDEEEAEA